MDVPQGIYPVTCSGTFLTNKAAVMQHLCAGFALTRVFISAWQIPGSGTAGSYRDSLLQGTLKASFCSSELHDMSCFSFCPLTAVSLLPIASWLSAKVASPDFPVLSHLETPHPSPQGHSQGLTPTVISGHPSEPPQALPACPHSHAGSWQPYLS